MRGALVLLFALVVNTGFTQSRPKLNMISVEDQLTFWAISAVDDRVVWVSANNGTVGRSVDGGVHWTYHKVKGFEQKEFRSIYGFSEDHAIIASIGSPACILRTSDGGKNWEVVYRNESAEAFIDGIDFWENQREGIVYGDPIKRKMLVLRTADGGKTWLELADKSRPVLSDGEASFASSGTGIRCFGNENITIATGGKSSRVLLSRDKGNSWIASGPLLRQGSATGGVFSIAVDNDRTLVVGGDFQDSLATELSLYQDKGTWKIPGKQPGGTRWCVEFIGDNTAVAVGPSGGDITFDGGRAWEKLFDDQGFHVVRRSRKGSLVVVAGSKSLLGVLK